MALQLPIDIDDIKGFLSNAEGEALYQSALEVAGRGPVLEVGSYCGKSTVYLGLACRERESVVYAVDHHRGSEEHQPGEFFHDPDLFDADTDGVDSFREFRRNIQNAGLDDAVVPLVAPSEVASRHWVTPLAMAFIDGGHSLDAALTDYRCWAPHVMRGGILAIHDLFDNAEDGGQAPMAVYRLALASGLFERLNRTDSLGLLLRL